MMPNPRIPLTIVTGFLGSGKTTLLCEVLARPDMADTLILMNEVADVGIDDRLLQRLSDDTILLKNGCVCCSVRDDLQQALLKVVEAPPAKRQIQRIVLETTGLADPRGFIATIVGTPVIARNIELNGVLTLVDCANACSQLAQYPEFESQLTIADIVLLTKLDLVTPSDAGEIDDLVGRLNPTAAMVEWGNLDQLCRYLNGGSQSSALFKLAGEGRKNETKRGHRHSDVESFSITIPEACDWARFAIWLSMFVHAHGVNILRIKGILYLEDSALPVAINCVQHLVYLPDHLRAWPGEERFSVMVFILRGISQEKVMRSLNSFLAWQRVT